MWNQDNSSEKNTEKKEEKKERSWTENDAAGLDYTAARLNVVSTNKRILLNISIRRPRKFGE
jgi:hypothetical protein